jgi:thioredoxin-like negative regulator of GroEL
MRVAMEPVMGGGARTSDVAVATMNPRDDQQLVEEYDVRSVPKLLAFVDGELVDTREDGFLGVDEVTAFLDEATVDGS